MVYHPNNKMLHQMYGHDANEYIFLSKMKNVLFLFFDTLILTGSLNGTFFSSRYNKTVFYRIKAA